MDNKKLTWNGMPLILDENSPDQPLLLSNTKDGVVILNTITGEKLKIIEQQIVYIERIEDEK